MIDANEPTPGGVVKQETPARITTSMIINDLENGIDRNGIRDKYSLQAWEVKQMFEHPALKGKKAKKVRKLSFTFVDDTTFAEVDVDDTNQTSIRVESIDVNEEAAMDSIANTINNIESTEDNQLTQF